MNRDNFDGSIYDSESDLQMLGFSMYYNEMGRFTTPDLLWSAFPAHTPYHYAYNSPLTYRDPSGLAAERGYSVLEYLDMLYGRVGMMLLEVERMLQVGDYIFMM